MTSRRPIAAFAPGIAALFALTVAVPQSAVLYHSHAGGDHSHVHADDAIAIELLAELSSPDPPLHHHHHHHHHPHPSPDDIRIRNVIPRPAPNREHPPHRGVALGRSDSRSVAHCHQQERFQRALAASPPPPAIAHARPLPDRAALLAPIHVATRDRRARGPPTRSPTV